MTDIAHDFSTGPELKLGIDGFSYVDLYDPVALARLSDTFDAYLADEAPGLADRLRAYRACAGEGMSPEDVSGVLTDAGPYVGHFIARLFNIEDEFEVSIPGDPVTLATVGDVVRYIDGLVATQHPDTAVGGVTSDLAVPAL